MSKKLKRVESANNAKSLIFREDRTLLPREYANLRTKQKDGYMNAHFFRGNMFNATARGKRKKYKKLKIFFHNKEMKIGITHSLHQKHADVFSLLHTESILITKPEKNGTYYIYFSLYAIAKAMGYKNPSGASSKVKSFIQDLRDTDIHYEKDNKGIETKIFNSFYFDKDTKTCAIKIDGEVAKILTYSMGIKISKEYTHKIVAIPDKYVKVKAIVRYMTSHKAKANGYSMEWIFKEFNIHGNGNRQVRVNKESALRKQLKENENLLAYFNMEYVYEEDKLYYHKTLDAIQFELPMPVLDEVMYKESVAMEEETIEAEIVEIVECSQIGKYIASDFFFGDGIERIYCIEEIEEIIPRQLFSDGNTMFSIVFEEKKTKKRIKARGSLENLDRHIEEFTQGKLSYSI